MKTMVEIDLVQCVENMSPNALNRLTIAVNSRQRDYCSFIRDYPKLRGESCIGYLKRMREVFPDYPLCYLKHCYESENIPMPKLLG